MHNGGDLAFVFDGSFDGFLNVVYIYYYEKLIPKYIFPDSCFQQILDAEYVTVPSDSDKAEKVFRAVKKNTAVAENLYYAFLNCDENKYMDMFKYTLLGFKLKGSLDNYKQIDYVLNTQKLALAVSNEAHLLKGFCRFCETQQNVFYAKITPKHDVLPILSEHFADRFKSQKWVIHDTKRGTAALYDTQSWYITEAGHFASIEYSDDEQKYQEMWKSFCESISIKDRKNIKLQKQFIRRHHRETMFEFTPRHK